MDNIIISGAALGDWNFGNGTTATGVQATSAVYDTPGLYTVTVNGTFTNGFTCTASTTISVRANVASASLTAHPIIICDGDSAQLTATGGEGYQWSTGDLRSI
ncbi:MAG: PKD domain-containing protein [Bacteroidota bacterium]